MKITIVFLFAIVAIANGSLLEMSQTLWTKVLEGGLTKIGALDPLRVPVVKVDQSEGNTSYRMILRGLQIIGLNSSTLESVHIGRGRLKSNLSEHEAGYVSYTDQRELDTIRYRFHTVIKEPKIPESQNFDIKTTVNRDNYRNEEQNGKIRNYEISSRYQNNQQQARLQNQKTNNDNSQRYQDNQQRFASQGTNYESSVKYQDNREKSSSRYQENRRVPEETQERSNYEASTRYQDNRRVLQEPQERSNYETSTRYHDNRRVSQEPQEQRENYGTSMRYQENRRVSNEQQRPSNYESLKNPEDQRRYYSQSRNSQRNFEEFKSEYENPQRQSSRQFNDQQRYSADVNKTPERVQVVYAERLRTHEDNPETRKFRPINVRIGGPSCVGNCQYRRQQDHSEGANNQREGAKTNEGRQQDKIGVAASMNFESRRAYVDANISPSRQQDQSFKGRIRVNDRSNNENRYAADFDAKSNDRENIREYQQYTESASSRLENQPGFVDIVYADDKEHKMRHFGNLKFESGRDKTVYSLDDVLRDLRDHKRFIIHNFTDGEALTKKNDAVRTATETKRIKDMIRYAKEYQEKNGYYEQGMQLIYHYGDDDDDYERSKNNQTRRNKRAHLDDETEDDVMHVIMRIRVPMLQVNAGYVLMGKVGEQVLRGNGQLAGNFTDLIGDFTLELKKINDDTMIVRAARARLSAKDKHIKLQGMDEKGPVQEIFTHGLMAAEAVAAMLADDLATKALSEKTADSIIYKMYKNLPVDNS